MELTLDEKRTDLPLPPLDPEANRTIPLIYTGIQGNKDQFSNVLLIDSSVKDYQTLVDSVNPKCQEYFINLVKYKLFRLIYK